jgi:hypothetical protein
MMTAAWCNGDVSMHSQHAMSASSRQTRQHNGTHLPRHQPRAEPSWAEPKDKILCSGVYVQPDLILNLGRSSCQNCFDQILAVWNAIWTISDLFPTNLIVPDAMVRSNHWDWDRKWWWWIIERDCPMKRHLKVIMVVDGDEEGESAHVCQITCAERLSGEKF